LLKLYVYDGYYGRDDFQPLQKKWRRQEAGHIFLLVSKSSERKCGNITTRYISHTCSVSIEYRTLWFYSRVRICSFQTIIDLAIL
jgi:hypothetical protein